MAVLQRLSKRKLFLGVVLMTILNILLFISTYLLIDDVANIKVKSRHGNFTCKFPDLPVYSPEMIKFVEYSPPINCSKVEHDWLVVEGSTCRISDYAKKRYKSVSCSLLELIRVDDFHSVPGQAFTFTDETFTFRNSDVIQVLCRSSYSYKTWKSILTGIRHDPEILNRIGWSNLPKDALHLNVLMFGFDSLSRNTYIRKLPKSYKYLTEVLGAVVLQGYNIVGDGTPQALIPILTGKTELELPDTRKRHSNATVTDVYPMIWKDFRKHGYVTGYLDDMPEYATFTYRLKGFKDPPTDHYMRPYYLATYHSWKRYPDFCYGSIPRHQIMMNHVKNFFKVYKDKPKFMFAFHGELSHDDYNLIGAVDDDLLKFLMELNDGGYLSDTILIMMADHGHRFQKIRQTVQGKQEERLPFFSFTFPPSFKTEHKEAYNNFVNNKNVLTTPFDIYSTLKSVLSLGNTGPADLKQRSLSLFSQIPKRRTCSDAKIEPHWCVCLEWFTLRPESPIIPKLTAAFVDKLNAYTKSHRNLCEVLSLDTVFMVTQLSPTDNLLRYKKNADLDGFVADFTAETKVSSNLYQITVQLKPGNSLFEASITHHINENKFEVRMSDISRINKYGTQARCIENEFPHLRKYCYCKDNL